jgi:hypothetical protein
MVDVPFVSPQEAETGSFSRLMQALGETFTVRHVMVRSDQIETVSPGELERAKAIVAAKNYSVVPISEDGESFPSVYCTAHLLGEVREVEGERATNIADYIPDSTLLAEAFSLFDQREWYLTIRRNRVAGLLTYWGFNSHEFRVQLYAALSRVEELSRDALAMDGCGVESEAGLRLRDGVIRRARKAFKSSRNEFGGNRFVDELLYSGVHEALKHHTPWREYLDREVSSGMSDDEYEHRFGFTKLRNAVAHGQTLFPTYRAFKARRSTISRIGTFIQHLEAYFGPANSVPKAETA